MRTPTQMLADELLGEPVEQWVAERRSRQPAMSWRRIALELRDVTERKVDPDPQTVANWLGRNAADDADQPAEAGAR